MTGAEAVEAGPGTAAGLERLLRAGSVAVVGASDRPATVGYRPVRFLLAHGYGGRIHPVNPRLRTCQGLRCHPSLSDLPEVPDVVVVAVRAALVPEVLAEAGALGVRAAVVLSSGFGESGADGVALEREVAAIARRHDMAVVGPNSVGVVHVPGRLSLSFSEALVRGSPRSGGIGMVSQSGAFGTVLFATAQSRGLGLHTYVSSGNEAVVGFADHIEVLAAQPGISVIGGYVEGLRDGARFLAVAREARRRGKPLVVMKVGAAAHASRAVRSHTGMLAGDDRAYEVALRRAGVVRVADEVELLDVVEAFDTLRALPVGGRVAVVSMSGGAGVLLSDLIERSGLTMAELTPETHAALRERLPAFASVRNPVDLTARFVTDGAGLVDVLEIVRADPQVDVVVVFTGLGWAEHANWAEALAEAAGETPMVCVYPLCGPSERDRLRGAGIPVYGSVPGAVRALSAAVWWARWVPYEPPPPVAPPAGLRLRAGPLTETEAKDLVAAAGIAVPRGGVARSPGEAAAIARDLGGTLVLKASSTLLPHKSDVEGLVLLDVPADGAVAAFQRVRAAVASALPGHPVPDVLVEEMVGGGVECVIGAVRASPFGHLVMVGLGGVHVEVMRDVAFGLAPLPEEEALAMIRSLRAHPVLRGDRGGTRFDVPALARTVSQVSRFVAGLGADLVELDLNPVCVREDGLGVVVLDAFARFAAEGAT